MKRAIVMCAMAFAASCLSHAPAFGALGASATILSQQSGPNYTYSLTLTNTGTTPIGTLWFGWIPAYDLLPTAPLSIAPPTPQWSATNAPDAIGVASAQWVNTTTPLQPGQTLGGFSFTTSDPPSVILFGKSSLIGLPIDESYVYTGAPEVGAAFAFQPAVVTPEPASVMLLPAALGALLVRRKRH